VNAGDFEVELNGVRLHYSVRGSGPELIAVSGGPGMDARAWDHFAGIDRFATLIILHPRGSGLSGSAPDGRYLIPDYAADLEALRLHLGLQAPAVIGWSHGGMVAQHFAYTFADSLSRLILLDTTAHFGGLLSDIEAAVQEFSDRPWFDDSLAALKAEWDGKYETDEDMGRLWADEMKFYFHRFDERAAAYHARTRNLSISVNPLRVFNEQEAPHLDLRPGLPRIKVPTLVLVGRHDFITNVAMAREMARSIPDAQLVIFEDSGHFAMIEEPEKFHRVVKDFLLGA
jgi:pimeloyl-ACP methyl ester carboxylesterase